MLRAILDTSVLVSAMRSLHGASARLIEALDAKEFVAVVSSKLVLEYEKLLRRDIQGTILDEATVNSLLDFMCIASMHVEPHFLLRPVLPDADDEFLLELAVAGDVQYIVTHNVRDFGPTKQYRIEAITPGRFLRMLREKP